MRIALCDYSGHPFQAQLSRALAARGHDVLHLYFSEFQTPKGKLTKQPYDPENFAVEGVSLGRAFAKATFVKRRSQEIEIGKTFARRLCDFQPDAVIASNFPLDTLAVISARSRKLGARFIFWQQDIYSVAIKRILSQKLGLLGGFVGFWYHRLEGRLLRSSDAVVTISKAFVSLLEKEFRVDPGRISVIENWAPLNEIVPRPRDNDWATQNGLADKQVVLYTGTLGMKHDPAKLLEIARRLQARPGALMVVVSEGLGAEWLAKRIKSENIPALRVLPFQPYAVYSDVLGSADILVSILEPEAGAFSVPSKVLSYLCSARPIVFSAPLENLASEIVMESGAGHVVAADDGGGLANAVLEMLDDEAARNAAGKQARDYAERVFDIEKIADRFEALSYAHITNVRPAVLLRNDMGLKAVDRI